MCNSRGFSTRPRRRTTSTQTSPINPPAARPTAIRSQRRRGWRLPRSMPVFRPNDPSRYGCGRCPDPACSSSMGTRSSRRPMTIRSVLEHARFGRAVIDKDLALRVGGDAQFLARVDAALRSIVRRDTGKGYEALPTWGRSRNRAEPCWPGSTRVAPMLSSRLAPVRTLLGLLPLDHREVIRQRLDMVATLRRDGQAERILVLAQIRCVIHVGRVAEDQPPVTRPSYPATGRDDITRNCSGGSLRCASWSASSTRWWSGESVQMGSVAVTSPVIRNA